MGGMGPGALGVGGVGPPSSSAFNLPGSLGQLVSTPGSPSRLLGPAGPTAGPTGPAGPSQSPFPMIVNSQLQQAGGPVGTQVGPTGTVSLAMAHLNAQHGADKARIGECDTFHECNTFSFSRSGSVRNLRTFMLNGSQKMLAHC